MLVRGFQSISNFGMVSKMHFASFVVIRGAFPYTAEKFRVVSIIRATLRSVYASRAFCSCCHNSSSQQGGMTEVKAGGKYRQEGKNYIVKDGVCLGKNHSVSYGCSCLVAFCFLALVSVG